MGHTPGPWENPPLSVTVRGADGLKICDMSSCYRNGIPQRSIDEQEANAVLTAAAPGLFDACTEMLAILECIDFSALDEFDYDKIPFEKWEKAIKKAEG